MSIMMLFGGFAPFQSIAGEIGERDKILIIREPHRLEPSHQAAGGCLRRCSRTTNDPLHRRARIKLLRIPAGAHRVHPCAALARQILGEERFNDSERGACRIGL
jgi:hypothetical protein